MDINYTLIGKRVASRRKQLKLTQAELAEKTELTPKYISNIETSHSIPSIETVMKLCSALGVDANYLLFGISLKVPVKKIEEIDNLLSVCTSEQLDKIKEYIEFLTSR